MHSSASNSSLRAFVTGFSAHRSSRVVISEFLVPSALRWPISPRRVHRGMRTESKQITGYERLFTNTEADCHKESGSIPVERPMDHGRSIWIRCLDPYLPLELRSRGWLENLAKYEGIRPIHTLPKLLQEAQPHFRMGLLSYLALQEGRLDAVLWLVRAMLSCKRYSYEPHYSIDEIWRTVGSLDEFTAKFPSPLELPRRTEKSLLTLDEITDLQTPPGEGLYVSSTRIVIGQILQCVGHMILESGSPNTGHQHKIKSTALQILAYMHHYDAIPPLIYDYGSAKDYPVFRKPPILFLMRSRILVALSDALWRAQEKKAIAQATPTSLKYDYEGHELPGAEIPPSLYSLGRGIWLELILWACAEGCWHTEAAKILNEMAMRKSAEPWSVASWDAIRNEILSTLPTGATLDVDSMESAVSTYEGYNADPPMFSLGDNTVSSEVVARTADGLLSDVEHRANSTNVSWTTLRNNIAQCKLLLDRQQHDLDPTFWNSVVLRLIKAGGSLLEKRPALLSGVLDLAPSVQRGNFLTVYNGDELVIHEQEPQVHSAATFGILHKTLDNYIHLGNLEGALMTFRRLQKFTDDNRTSLIYSTTTGAIDSVISELDVTEANERIDVAAADMAIPENTMAAFLDMIINAKLLELGRWLIYSKDVDGPVITFASLRSSIIQPALLRFAMATADSDLLIRILKQMGAQSETHSADNLRSILHCQIVLRKWAKVIDMLEHFKNERSINLETFDLMVFASQVVRQENAIHRTAASATDLSQALDLFKEILDGKYNPAPDRSKPQDYSYSRKVNQVIRILASVPGGLAEVAGPLVQHSGQAHATTDISVESFNILLDSIVEARGPMAGKKLVGEWCRIPESSELQVGTSTSGPETIMSHQRRSDPQPGILPLLTYEDTTHAEKVVDISRQTIRIILWPILQPPMPESLPSPEPSTVHKASLYAEAKAISIRRDLDTHFRVPELQKANPEDPLVIWAVAMYRRLGMTDEEIARAVPGAIPKPTKKRPSREVEQKSTALMLREPG